MTCRFKSIIFCINDKLWSYDAGERENLVYLNTWRILFSGAKM